MKNVTFRVVGEDPIDALVPAFANFVAISHAGSEVQIEFIFLDINQIAAQFGQPGTDDTPEAGVPEQTKDVLLKGKTVAKLVVPVASFVQLEEHLIGMFRKFREASNASQEIKQSAEEDTEERGYGTH